jgi:hypothetical protein
MLNDLWIFRRLERLLLAAFCLSRQAEIGQKQIMAALLIRQ